MSTGKQQDILNRLGQGVGQLAKLAPEQTQKFLAFNDSACKPGVLDTKTKELISLALAVGARCDGCIAVHVNGCVKAGATAQEVGETLAVAVSMGGGPSLIYATRALEALDELGMV